MYGPVSPENLPYALAAVITLGPVTCRLSSTNLTYTIVLYGIVSCQAFCCDKSGIHGVNRGKLVLHICNDQEPTTAVFSVRTT